MPKPMNEIERRVVGTLIEKVLSTPTAYPLTLNSLVAGCNQKSNREPEMTLSDDTVQRTLHALQEAGLRLTTIHRILIERDVDVISFHRERLRHALSILEELG